DAEAGLNARSGANRRGTVAMDRVRRHPAGIEGKDRGFIHGVTGRTLKRLPGQRALACRVPGVVERLLRTGPVNTTSQTTGGEIVITLVDREVQVAHGEMRRGRLC